MSKFPALKNTPVYGEKSARKGLEKSMKFSSPTLKRGNEKTHPSISLFLFFGLNSGIKGKRMSRREVGVLLQGFFSAKTYMYQVQNRELEERQVFHIEINETRGIFFTFKNMKLTSNPSEKTFSQTLFQIFTFSIPFNTFFL